MKHPQLAEFYDFDPNIYDIEGHRVRTSNGLIDINIDGIAFDQVEVDRWLRLGEAEDSKSSRFHVRLPPK